MQLQCAQVVYKKIQSTHTIILAGTLFLETNMSSFKNRKKTFLSLVALLGVFFNITHDAMASSSFEGFAELTYNVSGVDLSDISITTEFDHHDNGSYGEGVWLTAFTQNGNVDKFSVTGNVDDGEVNASYFGSYNLTVINNSYEQRIVDVDVSYLLSAFASGENAQIFVQLEDSFAGYADAYAYEVEGDSTGLVDATGFTNTFSFLVSANSQKTLNLLNVGVVGHAFGTTPVPLPAAAFSFLIGLIGMFGFNKKTKLSV